MPIYEYECKNCDIIFELISKFTAICPKCLSSNIIRLISLGTFRLKGKGWSKDGYTK